MSASFLFPGSDVHRPSDVVVGFHGTRGSTARTIVDQQQITVCPHSYDWLGPGAYFWEAYVDRAWRWAYDREAARVIRHGGEHERVGVVRAEVRLGNCVDFGELPLRELLVDAEKALIRQHEIAKTDVPENRGARHDYDCAVVNLLCNQMNVTVDTVRAIFPEGQPVTPRASLLNSSHIHLCVRNQLAIEKLELVAVVSWEEARNLGGIR